MGSRSFEREWSTKVGLVRASSFWHQVSNPPAGRIETSRSARRAGEVDVETGWSLSLEGDLTADGPASIGGEDLRRSLRERFGIRLSGGSNEPGIVFRLLPDGEESFWESRFTQEVTPGGIRVTAATETALLRAALWLSNYFSLRRAPRLSRGRREVRPAVKLHLGADLWGGFCTTQAWIPGRESDDNFLELARMGVNGVPVMCLLEDYLGPDPQGAFGSLANKQARARRLRLGRLARQADRFGVRIFPMAYDPKLDPDHQVFADRPQARGALQADGGFRCLCTSDRQTRRFLAGAWASLFAEIPTLGGLLAITGGEGFYHCFMRGAAGVPDCPRCSKRTGPETVAEFVNDVAREIHARSADALVVTWPYSAGHWSHDRDQSEFIDRLDPEHVIFQTEIDKDSVDWREAGYAKDVWDYSMSRTTTSDRCRAQRRRCRKAELPFSVKIECNNSIECLSAPYLPALENQRAIWENARGLRPTALHSRWLFDGSCKSPSEEMGFWALWGRNTEFADLDKTLHAIACRDFGEEAAPLIRRAWSYFSEGLRHHPQLDYYKGSYFIGAGQPLILDAEKSGPGGGLDPAFFGRFYWHWEVDPSGDDSSLELEKPLFYDRPGFRALARRGPRRGQDVALEELQTLASLWEKGVRELEKARERVPASCRPRFRQEYVLGGHLGYAWRSGARVEEFLRLRDTISEFSGQAWVRAGHKRENMRDWERMCRLAGEELDTARLDLALVKDVDFLDLRLRLDMGTSSTAEILHAKIAQVENLLAEGLPAWRESLLRW